MQQKLYNQAVLTSYVQQHHTGLVIKLGLFNKTSTKQISEAIKRCHQGKVSNHGAEGTAQVLNTIGV